MVIKVLLFAGGVATGLFIAKIYAQQTVANDIHNALPNFLQGTPVETVADKLLVPT